MKITLFNTLESFTLKMLDSKEIDFFIGFYSFEKAKKDLEFAHLFFEKSCLGNWTKFSFSLNYYNEFCEENIEHVRTFGKLLTKNEEFIDVSVCSLNETPDEYSWR